LLPYYMRLGSPFGGISGYVGDANGRNADLGGSVVDFSAPGNRGYTFVDVTFLRRDGRLLY